MVESYTPHSLHDRSSQKLGFGKYLLEQFAPKWALLLGGLVGGWIVGGMIGGAMGATRGRMFGQQAGSLIGGAVLGFMNWRKKAASEMDSAELATKMRDYIPMGMTNEQVTTEIAHTKELLAYEQRQNNKLQSILSQGPRSHQEHATAEASQPGRE